MTAHCLQKQTQNIETAQSMDAVRVDVLRTEIRTDADGYLRLVSARGWTRYCPW